jgi:hypothetical protein
MNGFEKIKKLSCSRWDDLKAVPLFAIPNKDILSCLIEEVSGDF